MKKEEFKGLVNDIGALSDRSIKLYELGVDLIEFEDSFQSIINKLGVEAFGENVWDNVDLYLYEAPKDGTPCMWDEDDRVIPMDNVDDLCNFLTSAKLIKWD